ncbi:ATP-binding cassette domain-containing protein [Acidocella aminolytica]|uniref:ATP-binding protein Uup n=1 Tax=Acidocella aminolytica 101 = DSM 11237 TaxID=1120923 RepID=A0A0D6PIZ3_9PROT|nr:ATP-binding cassette domain-containing protein [Acidocella aminolytica]GAN81720.1 ABC transporter [Acidocella aminolytica 101 = DSM 11237]GBQ38321.1 ABC transporter ATP-binding protein [Acidocella aminolytica 101 = DSM 11237]SHF44095.1 ATP-binding cassette, subfamily F, uup [Acidocella aminolytica 101 = DSM 11237]
MAPPLLLLTDISLTLGSVPLLERATLSVGAGERICLVGRNGSGKSTLLKIASGEVPFDGGTRFFQPGATMRYLPQEPDLSAYADVMEYVLAGLGPNDDEYRVRYLLGELGLSGAEKPSHLSGGEARRAALARILAPEPDLLLLDEPTNHLDLPAIEWLEGELKSVSSGLVLISHDRRFLENLSRSMVWLDRGQTRRLDKSFAHFEAWRDEVLEQEEQEFHKLGRKIAREEDWLRYGVTARRKRNVKRLAGLHTLRAERRNFTHKLGTAKLATLDAATSGRIVVDADGIFKSFGEKQVVNNLTFRVLRGDRLGIVGPNGAGKSTLLKLILGQMVPDFGAVKLGSALDVVTLDQQRADLNPAASLADTLTGGNSDQVVVGGQARHVIGYMKDFLFKPEQARTPVGTLSGGERGRLLLALALTKPSNLLVLDEPTNDLDLETLDLLQEMLGDYPGTVIVVSHDRDFLDRVCTSVLMFEGRGRWVEYAGGYSDMLAQRGAGIEVVKAEKAEKRTAPKQAPAVIASAKTKISFKEQHELKQLNGDIAKLQLQMAQLEDILATPDLYTKDPKKFAQATAALADLHAKLEKAEERWLELEMLKEG